MEKRDDKGISLREYYQSVAKDIGRKPKELLEADKTRVPELMGHLWNSFLDLSNTRSGGSMGGLLPISYLEIKSYAELMDKPLTAREVKTLVKLDRIYLRVFN